MAGTYWRVWGHQHNAAHCYRHALRRVPAAHRDVALTNLAGLLYKAGGPDDAVVLMKEALEVDDRQPEANLQMGAILNAKANLTGSIK